MAIAHCGLRHLRDQGLRVAQQQNLQRPISMELVLELLSDQPVSVTGALYDRPTWGGFTAHEQRDADEAFVADHRNFRRGAVFQHVQQRHDGVDRKVNVAQDIAGLVQNLPERHRDEPQMRVESIALRGCQRSQQVILLWIVGVEHEERHSKSNTAVLPYKEQLHGSPSVRYSTQPPGRAALL